MKIQILAALLLAAAVSAQDRAQPLAFLSGQELVDRISSARAKLAKNPNDAALQKELGIVLHVHNEKSRQKPEVEEGVAVLKKYLAAHPEDAEVRAWYGSMVTMQAEFETNPGKQTFLVKLGARDLDKAVKEKPDDMVIRLIRAHNSLSLPPFLERGRFATEDFGYVKAYCATHTCEKGRAQEAEAGLAEAKAKK